MSLVDLHDYEPQVIKSSKQSAVCTSRGHPKDISDDQSLPAITFREEDSCNMITGRDLQELRLQQQKMS